MEACSTKPAGRSSLENTRNEFSFEGKILSGPFKGDREVVTLSGQFNPKNGTGLVDTWESRVGGDPHYRLDFDDPIRLQDLGKDSLRLPPTESCSSGTDMRTPSTVTSGKISSPAAEATTASVASVATMCSTAAVERTSCRVEMATIA